jgi:hypothetical protein
MKRLILNFKQRDGLDAQNRSVFYMLMFQIVITIASTNEYKALSILSTTKADLL